MKNLFKFTLAISSIAGFCLTASAQRGFDYFFVPGSLVLPANNFSAGTGSITNGPYDVRTFDGIAKVDLFCYTNSVTAGGTMTAQLFGSDDTTNKTALSGIAFVNGTTAVNYTNGYYGGTNLIATNSYLLPGTITTPTAATAGFATPYLTELPFTNSGAITIPTGWSEMGFSISDAKRYIYIVWTPGGTVTNFTAGGVLTGAKNINGYPF